ncbi:MAG: HDOD domain-containing protein [Candidatus Cloacimonetes bacterium]|nr:HDOD domain-containing protein [Candidatus Cloacimonadota bacterium]
MDTNSHFLSELFIAAMNSQALAVANTTLLQLMQAIECSDTPIEKLVLIIEKDPGITAAMLKAANSSFYGLSKKVVTIKHAITVLGLKTLKNLLISQSIRKTFVLDNAEVTTNLWKHSLFTAVAAKDIISGSHEKLSDQAFIAGLLHDLGKFILLNFRPKEMKVLLKKLEADPHQYSVSRKGDIWGRPPRDR